MATQRSAKPSYKRRSTRVTAGVPLNVRGVDANGQPFLERRVTLEVSSQGCKYYSRYALPPDSWLNMEITNNRENSTPQAFRARVAWLRRSQHLRGLFQVGVELEAPGNVWGLANPPEDWQLPAAPVATKAPDVAAFEREMKEMVALAETGTYYQLLKMTPESPRAQIRQNYYEFVRKFHPDRHMNHAEWIPQLTMLLETVTLAYKTVTDEAERQKYEERLAASSAFGLGQHSNAAEKTAEDCLKKARECFKAQNRGGTILWLRKAVEMEPESSKYHALLARTLSAVAPMRHEAIKHYEKSLELDPWNMNVRFQLGVLCEEMKLPWRARPHYKQILDIDPDHAKAKERMCAIDAQTGKKGAGKKSIFERILHRSTK